VQIDKKAQGQITQDDILPTDQCGWEPGKRPSALRHGLVIEEDVATALPDHAPRYCIRHVEIARRLVEQGVDMNVQDWGLTRFQRASKRRIS